MITPVAIENAFTAMLMTDTISEASKPLTFLSIVHRQR